MKLFIDRIRIVAIAVFCVSGYILAWDNVPVNFPHQDEQYIETNGTLPPGTADYVAGLGYNPVRAMSNRSPYGTTLWSGLPAGDPNVVRATLALLEEATQKYPSLFPDWPAVGIWQRSGGPWATTLEVSAVQHQYEYFTTTPPAMGVMSETSVISFQSAGSASVAAGGTQLGPQILPSTNNMFADSVCLNEPVSVYSAYGNAIPSVVPVTLQDEGPAPVKDEQAWRLPSGHCH